MKYLVLLQVVCFVFFAQSALAKERIKWVKWNLVPEYIDSGKFAGEGYLDKFLDYILRLYPEYDHEIEYQTLNRLDRSWADGNVCAVHLWLGYWPNKILYSEPYGFTPRFGIVTDETSQMAAELRGQQSVSLDYLLSSAPYKMGILPLNYLDTENSRYPQLQPIIAKYKDTYKVNEFSNGRNEISFELIDRGRVDYIIRQRITHFSELRIKGKSNRYQFHYIDEGMTYKQVAAACSNSDLGQKVIKKFNRLIDESLYRTYLKYRQEWDIENKVYEQVYLDYFVEDKPNPYVVE